ncbi:LemA family protein [Epilithonimonas mollis]|uniref:LemA protein n=1 Tax=Epilithonimonas mollis TaxID=216903 RepID=A0A1M6S7P9_9FLAO|nr:LemA family protein [Epilithonimonas mollis]SHK40709.1 LemA protein [Epilithonimonas mollis]
MKGKGCIVIAVILGLIAVVVFWGSGRYNYMVQANNDVLEKWANVETVYQKRANLIPNLERTVKSYAKFEQETLTQVVEARAKATAVNVDPTNMTEADMAKFQQAQGQLSGALGRLLMVVEKYPDLKADQQYINFQREYTAIENSIRSETVYYNGSVKSFNNLVETFPGNIVAAFFPKFSVKPTFKAEAGAEKAPSVFSE